MKQKKIKNSDKFRESVLRYLKTGRYSPYPEGTLSDLDFWTEEQNRSVYGYTAKDGDHITGYHYFYLNYCIIERLVDKVLTYGKNKGKRVTSRTTFFPDFYDYDYYFYNLCEEAEENNQHMTVLKKRGSGQSFKGASMLVRNYFCIEGSSSYAIAASPEFLVKDGILSKAWVMMDFIDANTGFAKRRDVTTNRMHRRASYIETDEYGKKIEKGYKSEIIGISTGSSAGAIRGKRGKLFIIEEAGSNEKLEEIWNTIRSSVEEAGITFGMLLAQGTAGDRDSKFAGLRKMFYKPRSFNILPVKNIWDDGMGDTECCFFVPEYVNLSTRDKKGNRIFMDKDGNTLYSKSIEFVLEERKKIKDADVLDRYVAEHPMTPQEAMLEFGGNIFPKKDLMNHLINLQSNKALSAHKQVGDLVFDGGKLRWIIKGGGDITEFPLEEANAGRKVDKSGSIVIWEHPVKDPPAGLYISSCDPYDFDESNYSTSLGSTFIYKRFQNFEEYYDIIVAEYTGRPATADEYYENVRRLLLYYNARLLYENEKKGLHTYFTKMKSDYLLVDQPDILSDIVKGSKVNRKKGIHMSKPISDWAIGKLNEFLREEYAPGHMNLEKILSVPLIQELILYNSEKGNYDRVSSMKCLMILLEQMHDKTVKQRSQEEKITKIFDAPLFSSTINVRPLKHNKSII